MISDFRESPPPGAGMFNAAGAPSLLAGVHAWHAQAEAVVGHMSAVATSLRMAPQHSGVHVEVSTVAPYLASVTAAHDQLAQQYGQHRLTAAAMDSTFAQAAEHGSSVSAFWSFAPGGGGGEGCSTAFDIGTSCPIQRARMFFVHIYI